MIPASAMCSVALWLGTIASAASVSQHVLGGVAPRAGVPRAPQSTPPPGVSSLLCRPIEDGLTCPCNNQPTTPNAGCNGLNPDNTFTGGAVLSAAGTAIPYDAPGGEANDPAPHVMFSVAGLPNGMAESAMLLQGTTTVSPLTFGQGLRCCGGPLKRLTPSHIAVGTGSTFWPNFGGGGPDFYGTISERSNNLPGAPVHILPAQTYCYFVQYRQALFIAPCGPPANFNSSETVPVAWHL